MQENWQLQSSVQLFDIAFSIKKFNFVVRFLNAFWHGNKTFPQGSSQNQIVPLLVVFHLPYGKYKGVKICFNSCRYQNQKFFKIFQNSHVGLVSFVQHSCGTRVALVPLVQHSCRTCAALVLLVFHSCRIRVTSVALVLRWCRSFCACVARVWHLCCKLDQIVAQRLKFYKNFRERCFLNRYSLI